MPDNQRGLMNPEQWKILHAGELAFFAKISASVSHEIKNHLAIINEQNGLLGDLLAMAAKGGALQAPRLNAVVGDISRQVTLTDTIVRRFNIFAHTADKALDSVDVKDSLALLVQIAGRLARLREMALVVLDCPEHVQIRTHPFEFLHVIYLCLDMLLNGGAAGRQVDLGFSLEAGSVRVLLAVAEGLNPERVNLDVPLLQLLSDRLQATLASDQAAGRLSLTFPLNLDPRLD